MAGQFNKRKVIEIEKYEKLHEEVEVEKENIDQLASTMDEHLKYKTAEENDKKLR